MRVLRAETLGEALAELCRKAACELPGDVLFALQRAAASERHPRGKRVLELILENAEYARQSGLPLCQDTGVAVVFLDWGREVVLEGASLEEAVNSGVAKGYTEAYLRKSVVKNPLERVNTGDNTPAVIHLRYTEGDKVRVTLAPKGAGSENKSKVFMLDPSAGVEGVVNTVVDTVEQAGASACPPLVVGVGLGGTLERAALLAKYALLRPLGQANPEPVLAELEARLLEEINATGIGPAGLGGDTTALGVHVEATGCHIASLPVAVNLNCHAARHAETIL
jgi:fumarate hydratase subunit alpha